VGSNDNILKNETGSLVSRRSQGRIQAWATWAAAQSPP